MSRIGDGGQSGQGEQSAVQNLGATANQMGQQLRDLGGQVREQATQRYEQLRDQATDYYQQGRDRAQQWEKGLEDYIHEKPLQAVLLAAGVGVLLGVLWKRS
jgi:ElaB/YqjD/DUF883 family membrane-anchored ribosome-binding protein